jgi:hypothetical protein
MTCSKGSANSPISSSPAAASSSDWAKPIETNTLEVLKKINNSAGSTEKMFFFDFRLKAFALFLLCPPGIVFLPPNKLGRQNPQEYFRYIGQLNRRIQRKNSKKHNPLLYQGLGKEEKRGGLKYQKKIKKQRFSLDK